MRIDFFLSGHDGDLRRFEPHRMAKFDGIVENAPLGFGVRSDVHARIRNVQQPGVRRQTIDSDVAQQPARAESVFLVQDLLQDDRCVDHAFHQGIGTAARHVLCGKPAGFDIVLCVDDLRIARQAVFFAQTVDRLLVSEQDRLDDSEFSGHKRGFEHAVLRCGCNRQPDRPGFFRPGYDVFKIAHRFTPTVPQKSKRLRPYFRSPARRRDTVPRSFRNRCSRCRRSPAMRSATGRKAARCPHPAGRYRGIC